jgi:hypothetical protein
MNDFEFKQLKTVVKAYKDKKDVINKQINQIKQDVIEQKRSHWNAEIIIADLYMDLANSSERVKFSELSEKTNFDAEFEKYFRSAFLEIFLGIVISPENL